MIFITGDTHARFERFSTKAFPEQKEMSRDDYVIICGDFGGIWDNSSSEKYWLDWLSEKPFTLLFVSGNHENYDMLKEFPVNTWHGGKVNKIRPNIIHLRRGQVFDIEGKTFFTFGGARSHDISDGILSLDDPDFRVKYNKLAHRPGAMFRIDHVSWWKEEMPNGHEMNTGRKSLEKVGHRVDCILTHDCPTNIQYKLGKGMFQSDKLTDFLEEVEGTTEFTHWYFGHYHFSVDVTDKFTCLYREILRVQ